MDRLMQMKESLVNTVEQQINGNLECVDTKELGEAVDMIKDLEEAIYYCTITEAMKEKYPPQQPQQQTYYYTERMKPRKEMYPYMGEEEYYQTKYPMTMYYDGGQGNGGNMGGGRGNSGGTSYYQYDPGYGYGYGQQRMLPSSYDGYSGRSPMRRKMYMEGKMNHQDKTKQMQELENYVQELSQDITEMISDASPEEKQMLQQKISTLATKIK